nr:iron chelate uptake ABC transporter family permease subunit [Pseudonocardia spinosispora]
MRTRSTTITPGTVASRPALRVGRFSGVWRPRLILITLLGVGLVVLLAALNIGRGDYPISLVDVLRTMVGGGDGAQRFIVLELRLPRTLTGILVGAALGVAGAITQSIARNPLASPDMLGVTDGASAAAVLFIVLGGGATAGIGGALGGLGTLGVPAAALGGGLFAAVLVYGLAYRRGLDGYRLVLVGLGIEAVGLSITSWLLVIAKIDEAGQVLVWMRGSLNARGWEHVIPVGAALVLLVPVALILTFRLNALQLDDDAARGLGVTVNRSRTVLVLLAVLLAAVATACAGPIRFVALVVPQISLRMVGASRPPLLTSAVYGALLTVGSDLIGRTLFGDQLPVGIITMVLGAPYLLYLLVRRNRGVTTA